MKHIFVFFAAAAVLLATPAFADPVREQREWVQTFDVGPAPTLKVSNIWGDVRISRGDRGVITASISEDRRANGREYFELSHERIPLVIDQTGDEVSFFVGRDQRNMSEQERCRGCRVDYQFLITVPADTTLELRAINDGVVVVDGIDGKVSAKNINGPVTVIGLAQCEHIESINGEVALQLAVPLQSDCNVRTVNGDITITATEKSGIDLALMQSNGRMNSDFPLTTVSIKPEVKHRARNGQNQYEVSQYAGLRLGKGGHQIMISSLNGDVALVEGK